MRSEITRFDDAVDRTLDRVRGPALDGVVYRLSSAADHSLLWHACGAAVAFAHGDTRFAARFAAAMTVESLLTNGAVKTIFRRVRPAEYDDIDFHHGLHRPLTTSFPSGHATAAFCAATLLGGGPGWYGLAAGVAATRVYVRLHHASDVAAGAAFGLVLGVAARRFVSVARPESH
jgi:undecaprenyl-diphosphatase